MSSVTQRIDQIKQPYGGYLKPSEFKMIEFNDNQKLNEEENVHSTLVGLTVDYMTRFMMGTDVKEAFSISLIGASFIRNDRKANKLLKNIVGLDDNSIYNACKLVGYDVCYRVGPQGYKNVDEINANTETINNIRIMINRSLKFFEEYGPIVKDGFTFEGGYTETIDTGDGDFLTQDTLWDFKVSVSKPKTQHTLQLLVYYIMGNHSIHDEFKNIKKLGIYNPRLNCVFIKDIDDIPKEIIDEVSKEVIGYNKKNSVDYYTTTDLMNMLNCSRNAIMKYKNNYGLPLEKVNNKYIVNKKVFHEWLSDKQIEYLKMKKSKNTVIIVYIMLVIIAIVIGYFYYEFKLK